MKKSTICLVLLSLFNISLFSQPGSGRGFSLNRNLVYYDQGNSSLYLDLYTPGGQSMAGGIGVAGKDKFPTPVASFVGNGYAIVSIQDKNDSEKLKNISQAINYLKDNAVKYNLTTENIGIIQPSGNGYFAVIWQRGMEQLKSISDATIKISIDAPADTDFSKLQSSENTSLLVGFFDNHLNKGLHVESDPLSIQCPVDSWADPIINPIPGTSYHLFPTPVRGKGTQGSYLIYLPKDYALSNKRYPVIYWLHGGNGDSRDGGWMCQKMNEAMQSGDMPQSIVVFVQGLPIGWYNNSKDGTMPVEDVIIKDLIPHIDSTYRTINKREARGIDGMSMGGYGSLHLGFKYPELFGIVSSIAPSITTFEMERKEVIVPTFEDDAGYFNANSPSTLVQKNADYIRKSTFVRLLVGDKDFLLDLVQKFHQQLIDLQINHQYAIAKDADHDYKEVIRKLDFNSFTFWGEAFKLEMMQVQ